MILLYLRAFNYTHRGHNILKNCMRLTAFFLVFSLKNVQCILTFQTCTFDNWSVKHSLHSCEILHDLFEKKRVEQIVKYI